MGGPTLKRWPGHRGVYYRDEHGQIGKIWPSARYPELAIPADKRTSLPRLRADLRDPEAPAPQDPEVPAQEWMILCAFDHPEFAKQFAPPRGSASPEQLQQWHATLKGRLGEISTRHYQCEELGYRIHPRG